jgi:hypothetical protein
MKGLTYTIALCALSAASAAGQGGRISFELALGRSANSPLFEQAVGPDQLHSATTTTRLSIDDASTASGRVGYRFTGNWMITGELARSSTSHYYSKFVTGQGFVGYAEERRGAASETSLGLGVSHRTVLAALPFFIEPELAVVMRRIRVGNPNACIPLPPSEYGPGACAQAQRWEDTYSVPSLGAGVSAGFTIVSRLALEVRGRYSVGRTSTKKGFYDDLVPFLDYAEAPTSYVVRTSQLSAGFRITP